MQKILLVLIFLSASIFSFGDSKKPNFLLIMADDLGYSDIGCYGGEILTPNLDSLASKGLRFTDFYNTSRCWTTRSSIMCGYYHTQLNTEAMKLEKHYPKWTRTIAHMLKPLGYRTYHSGKWHIYPFDKINKDGGFDRSYYLREYNYTLRPKIHWLDDVELPAISDNDTQYEYTAKGVADYMIEFLKEHKENHSDKPFFGYLTFIQPHFPLQAPQKDIDAYKGKYSVGWDVLRKQRFEKQQELGFPKEWNLSAVDHLVSILMKPEHAKKYGPNEIKAYQPWDSLTNEQKKFQADKMAVHAAMVSRMDSEIGRVINQLKDMGEFENTVIMFLSDNGASAEMFIRGGGHDPQAAMGSQETYLCLGPVWANLANTPLKRFKARTNEGGIATPFIVHWGDKIKDKGAFRRTQGNIIDIMPTLIALGGGNADRSAEGAPPFPGKNLSEAFCSDKNIEREYLYFNHSGNFALIMGEWKVSYETLSKNKKKWQLYNLKNDRGEQKDLSLQYPEKFEEMKKKWKQVDAEFRAQAKNE